MAEDEEEEAHWSDSLRSDDNQQVLASLAHLSTLLDQLEGEDMWELCAFLRDDGLVAVIGGLVAHPEPQLHQRALLTLATLTTDDVDPASDDTKGIIKTSGSFEHVIPHLFSNVALTVAFACATIQNTVADMELTTALQKAGGVARLRELSHCDQPEIVQAAQA